MGREWHHRSCSSSHATIVFHGSMPLSLSQCLSVSASLSQSLKSSPSVVFFNKRNPLLYPQAMPSTVFPTTADVVNSSSRHGKPVRSSGIRLQNGGLFHLFISYRVKTEHSLAAQLHDKLHLHAANFRLPQAKWPAAVATRDASCSPSKLHVFLDTKCLQQGKRWDIGDGGIGGFVGGLSHSAVYLPLLSTGAMDGFLALSSEDRLDNLLLEMAIALELNALSPSSQDSLRVYVYYACVCRGI